MEDCNCKDKKHYVYLKFTPEQKRDIEFHRRAITVVGEAMEFTSMQAEQIVVFALSHPRFTLYEGQEADVKALADFLGSRGVPTEIGTY
jgi:hypothetical protein